MDKRYRIVPSQGVEPESILMDRIYAEIPADQPEPSSDAEGEWMCGHPPCPVRVVRLRVKAPFHRHLPRLRCPLCLRALEFHHWLNVIALCEVPAETKRGVRARKHPASLSTVERRRGERRRERGEAAS